MRGVPGRVEDLECRRAVGESLLVADRAMVGLHVRNVFDAPRDDATATGALRPLAYAAAMWRREGREPSGERASCVAHHGATARSGPYASCCLSRGVDRANRWFRDDARAIRVHSRFRRD